MAILRDHRERCEERARALGIELAAEAFVFSLEPEGSSHLVPSSVTQRYGRMVARLGLDTHLHNLRHYSATELIAAGVDVRTVAGRLGHSGGGTTTLRVYAAWMSEADQRAATGLAGRMPSRPASGSSAVERARTDPQTTRELLAVDLLTLITSGALADGDHLPGIKTLAAERGVSVSTVHRAFELLREWGAVDGPTGERPRVRPAAAETTTPFVPAAPVASASTTPTVRHWVATLRGPGGRRSAARVVAGDVKDPATFREHLLGIARMEEPECTDGSDSWIGRYELEIVPADAPDSTPFILRW